MSAEVVALRPDVGDVASVADRALTALHRHLDRCKLSANTVKAYKRQAATYMTWLTGPGIEHDDAFTDVVGAEAAVTAWRRSRIDGRAAPNTINQGIAALTLMYAQLGLRIDVKRATVPEPGEPDALATTEQGAVERPAARRSARDAAIIAVLLFAGAREEECARLEADDIAITARTGTIRLHGKGDQVRTVPIPPTARARITALVDIRGRQPGPLWTGQRGALTISGIVQVVLAVGADAKLSGLRPHRLRHTYATRLREGGADVAQVQALLGHASLDTSARYFRAGTAEQAAVVDRVFD
ncbi:tyrosine-type recombinase/integrase [Sphaerisporangium fuscum]|uniref:tyrosine-type recombinase/integrase n=1 Tax=Sphaerisporangium fuscum TaxID=2835868 RepID=UPI001BDC126F|nr:tyrosine-type recombinase/integrase [Sphaerisporangium fuscum]